MQTTAWNGRIKRSRQTHVIADTMRMHGKLIIQDGKRKKKIHRFAFSILWAISLFSPTTFSSKIAFKFLRTLAAAARTPISSVSHGKITRRWAEICCLFVSSSFRCFRWHFHAYFFENKLKEISISRKTAHTFCVQILHLKSRIYLITNGVGVCVRFWLEMEYASLAVCTASKLKWINNIWWARHASNAQRARTHT